MGEEDKAAKLARDIVDAALEGDVRGLQELLDRGADPNAEANWIPLHAACADGGYEVARVLVENGAEVSRHDDLGYPCKRRVRKWV